MKYLTNEALWNQYMFIGKQAFESRWYAVAQRAFHHAERVAAVISGHGVRVGVSLSWLSLCYFKTGNRKLARELALAAEHVLAMWPNSQFAQEIAANLAKIDGHSTTEMSERCSDAYKRLVLREAQQGLDNDQRGHVPDFFHKSRRAVRARQESTTRSQEMRELRNLLKASLRIRRGARVNPLPAAQPSRVRGLLNALEAASSGMKSEVSA